MLINFVLKRFLYVSVICICLLSQAISEAGEAKHRFQIDGDAELKYFEQHKSIALPNYIERVHEIGQRDVLKIVKLISQQGIALEFLTEAYASPELWYPKREELKRQTL